MIIKFLEDFPSARSANTLSRASIFLSLFPRRATSISAACSAVNVYFFILHHHIHYITNIQIYLLFIAF